MVSLNDWAFRREIIIDNTNINSDSLHFAIPIVLGTSVGQSNQDLSHIFTKLTTQTDKFKIAITKSDGTTQIYGEIGYWDPANNKAVIYVAKSDLTITALTSTSIYIYYDAEQADNTDYLSCNNFHGITSNPAAPKSIVYDCADNYGYASYMGLQQVALMNAGGAYRLSDNTPDFVAYVTSDFSLSYDARDMLQSSQGWLAGTNIWLSNTDQITNQRISCVLTTEITIDKVLISNFQDDGANTTIGVKNIVVTFSSDSISNSVYNDTITNATVIFNDILPEHIAAETMDFQVVYENPLASQLVWDDDFNAVYHMGRVHTNIFTGGTASAQHEVTGYEAEYAFDGDNSTYWDASTNVAWLKYDLGSGNSKILGGFIINPYQAISGSNPCEFSVSGSNDDTNWDVLFSGKLLPAEYYNDIEQFFVCDRIDTAYRYFRLNLGAEVYGTTDTKIAEFIGFCPLPNSVKQSIPRTLWSEFAGGPTGINSDNWITSGASPGIDFNGTNAGIELASPLIPASSNFTVTIKFSIDDYNATYALFSQYADEQAGRFYIGINATSGTVFVYNGATVVTSASAVGTGTHVVTVVRSGNTYTIYIDGTAANNADSSTALYQGVSSQIGIAGTSYPLDGTVFEVQVSLTARSGDWIKANYHALSDDLLTFGSLEANAQLIGEYDEVTVSEFTKIVKLLIGTVTYGHSTDVIEDNIASFAGNFTGTASAEGAGDSEKLVLGDAQYMENDTINIGAGQCVIEQNKYGTGGTGTVYYKTGSTVDACEADTWTEYTGPFESSGFVKVKVVKEV